jgi:hypothetical protein
VADVSALHSSFATLVVVHENKNKWRRARQASG